MGCPQCAQEVRQYLWLLIATLIERLATDANKWEKRSRHPHSSDSDGIVGLSAPEATTFYLRTQFNRREPFYL